MTPRQILALIATFAVIALVNWCINFASEVYL